MKIKYIKIFLCLVVLLAVPSLVMSQSFEHSSYELSNHIESVNIGLKNICSSAMGVSMESKPFPMAWAIVLNIIPGFGLGSYIQGDYFAAKIQLTASIVGFTVGGILVTYGMVGKHVKGGTLLKGHEIWLGWTIMGIGIGGSIIYGIVAAILYDPSSANSNNSNSNINNTNGNQSNDTNNGSDNSDNSSDNNTLGNTNDGQGNNTSGDTNNDSDNKASDDTNNSSDSASGGSNNISSNTSGNSDNSSGNDSNGGSDVNISVFFTGNGVGIRFYF